MCVNVFDGVLKMSSSLKRRYAMHKQHEEEKQTRYEGKYEKEIAVRPPDIAYQRKKVFTNESTFAYKLPIFSF